jgi:hypothetical protein
MKYFGTFYLHGIIIRYMKYIIFIFSLCFLLSCTDKEEVVGRLKLFELGTSYDDTVKLVLADQLGKGPICEGRDGEFPYGEGCQKVSVVKVGVLELRCIEFDSVKNAKKEAKRLNEYYYKNWVFDEANGEPPLESFVKNAFGAALVQGSKKN